MTHETEHQTRLRRAKNALEGYQAAENAARIALADASQATKRAREKYDALFAAEENRIYQLLKNKQP